MKIEELEEQLEEILQRTEAIKKQIEKAKKAKSINTYIPEISEKYFYPTSNQTSGKYEPCETTGANGYQVDAFRTEEQCQIACDYLNRIMPVLKYAIENKNSAKIELGFWSENKFAVEVFFISKEYRDKMMFFLLNTMGAIE